MGPALPISTQSMIPWPEAIVLTSVRNSGNVNANVSNAGVYQRPLAEAAPSKGVYLKFDLDVSVGSDTLAFVPKPGDVVQWTGAPDLVRWAGLNYTVLTVATSNWTLCHQLHCRNLILALDLRDTGVLKRPVLAQDSARRQSLGGYTTIADSVPCRLQPAGGDVIDALQRKTLVQRFTAFLGVQVVAEAKDKFTVNGQDYTVTGFHQPQRIDEVCTLDCELIL